MNLTLLDIIPLVFAAGYLAIIFEHPLKINKAAPALITGVLCWVAYVLGTTDIHLVNESLLEHLGEISGILFFLLGAMTIVELIDAHDGFALITSRIRTHSKRKMLYILALITFFLSPVLDNLTTTIVLVSLLRKLIADPKERMFFTGIVVIAANAGGAWSPIGDVTTTMLWIGGQISVGGIIRHTFLPSLACLLVPLFIVGLRMKGKMDRPESHPEGRKNITDGERTVVFLLGVLSLLFVPVFKTVTHLPPFMGMLFSLGIMWVTTEVIHHTKDVEERTGFSAMNALQKIDTPSILFFLGILLAISSLQATGHLGRMAAGLAEMTDNENLIVVMIGLVSAVVDNVPLVAATMGMYDLQQFPADSNFWLLLAYAAGTGGSALIIGSAAGVAAMGMEKISFLWYLRAMTLWALVGYFAGVGVFVLLH